MEVSDVKKYVKWKYKLGTPADIDNKTRELYRRIIRPVHLDRLPNSIGILLLDTAIEYGVGNIAIVAADVDVTAVNMCRQMVSCIAVRSKIEGNRNDKEILDYIIRYVKGGTHEKI